MATKESEREFERFIFENQSLIHKVCNMYCRSHTDKEDLFQEILIKLWRGRSSFKGHSKISTWIYRVRLNTAITQARKMKRSLLSYPEKVPEHQMSTLQESKENIAPINALYQSIDQLKAIDKAIIFLYLEDKPYAEISEIIGISEKNVSVKLVRIKRKLKTIMESSGTRYKS